MDGYPLADLAQELWSFTCRHISGHIYDRRKTYGVDIVGNGFELWRRLYRDYEGTSEIMNLNGTAKLMAFPQCSDYRKLNTHLDDFVFMLNRFGTGMPEAQVKARLWNILPDRMRTTIFDHRELNNHSVVENLEWARHQTSW